MSVASGRSEGVMIVQFTPAVDRRLNCNFQTPTSTGTSTSRTCASSSPDWINMYCAFGSSWAQAADDMNAEQTVTAAKIRSDFRPAFNNMNMRKNPHCVENGGHGTRAGVRITATPRIGKRIADCGDWPQSHRDTE